MPKSAIAVDAGLTPKGGAIPDLLTVFLPSLICTSRIFQHQAETLTQTRPMLLANHRSHDSMAGIEKSIVDIAPETFALASTSMGGYVVFRIMRHAPALVMKLVPMSSSAKPDMLAQAACVAQGQSCSGIAATWTR